MKEQIPLTQYAIQNAVHIIEGYFIARPNETTYTTFDRAKEEALENMKIAIANVEQISIADFMDIRTRSVSKE